MSILKRQIDLQMAIAALAAHSGIPIKTLRKIMAADKNLTMKTIAKIEDVLGEKILFTTSSKVSDLKASDTRTYVGGGERDEDD